MKIKRYAQWHTCRMLSRVCILTFFMLTSSLFINAQNITLSSKNQTIKSAFAEIEKQTNMSVDYDDSILDIHKKLNSPVQNKSLQEALGLILKETGCNYTIKGDHIIIYEIEAKERASGQQVGKKTIRGTVSDEYGDPIIGANVIEKGVNNGVATDINGAFTLVISENAVLQVTYIGYLKENVTVSNQQSIHIVLREDTQTLEEVVVVGYGTQKKVNLTGSVASINTESLKDRVQSNVLSSIQGSIPGVTIISRPGESPSINFRGRGNLDASAPLYVINGAISDETFFANLDPNSIESISFLKDAASSAIYGSRAAYGVVLVTTKKGGKERTNISYSGYVGLKTPTYLPDIVNSWEYAELLNEGLYNRTPSAGRNQAYSVEEIGWFKDGSKPDYYPNTDWLDLVLDKNVVTTQHSVNVSGGSDKVSVFTGLGYLYDDKYMPGQSSQRYNLDMSVSTDLVKWMTIKAGVKYIQNTSETKHGSASLLNFLLVPSTMVAKQSNGEWGSIAGGKQATQSFLNGNPLRALSKNNWNNSKSENTMIDLGFDIKPFDGFVVTGQGVYRGYENKYKAYTGLQDNVKFFETGSEIPGTGVYTNEMQMNWQSSNRMLYSLTARYDWVQKGHSITILGGTSYEHYKYERLYAKRLDFATDDMKSIETGATVSKDLPDTGGGMYENKMLSYFGRINYNYQEKYLFEANLRADASSRFYSDSRWGIFPSFSAGWRINQEDFMRDIIWINNLKVRASWGTLGNINNVGNYDYYQSYTNNANYSFDDTPVKGVLESKPANINLGWETVALTDIGLDLDFLNSKWSVTADYYIKKTSDILLGYNVPLETGISTRPSQNIGKVRNKGFELSVTHRSNIGDLSYAVSGNVAINSNEITDLGTSGEIIQKGGDKVNYILREGESVGSFYGYKTDGLYTQEEIDAGHYYTFGRKPNAGDIKYVPQRENVAWGSVISGEDRTIIGKDVPDVTYGVNLNLQYKGFELGLFGQGVSGTSVAFESEQVSCLFLNASPRKFHLKRWTEENPNPRAIYPRIYGATSQDDYNQYFSDYQIFDSDYFRIKNITFGYHIPRSVVSKIGISAFKVYVTGENLFTMRADKKMKDFDPESPKGRGLNAYGTKSVAFGINVSF